MTMQYFLLMLVVIVAVKDTCADEVNLQTTATTSTWNIITSVYPAAMGVNMALRVPDDEVAANEVDKTARATASGILTDIYTLASSITTDLAALEDNASNAAVKAGAAEILKGLFQGGGILDKKIMESESESAINGPRAGANEVIKGLYQGAKAMLNCVKSANKAHEVVSGSLS